MGADYGRGYLSTIGHYIKGYTAASHERWKNFITLEQRVQLQVPLNYAHCILLGVGSTILLLKARQLEQLRRKYQQRAVHIYSGDELVYDGRLINIHNSMISDYPQFISMLLIGGLESPLMSTAGGVLWLFSKVSFQQKTNQLYANKKQSRTQVALGSAGSLILMYCSVKLACRLLRSSLSS